MKNLLLSVFAFVAIGLPSVRGQSIGPSTLNATGGSATIGGNTYEWSVGEMVLVNTAITSSIVVTQGLLQPLNGGTSAGVTPDQSLLQYLSVFPNPANNVVNFTFNSPQKAVLGLRLVDVTGKVLQDRSYDVKVGTNTGQVDMSQYAAATYMLQVLLKDGDNTLANTAYKIQKLQ